MNKITKKDILIYQLENDIDDIKLDAEVYELEQEMIDHAMCRMLEKARANDLESFVLAKLI